MRKRSLPQPEERTERRISAATSLSICALTVIAQIVLTLALTQLLAEKISYVYFILELAGAVVAIWVYLRPGSPSYKLVWMCLLLALPVAGMILFLLWGGSHQAKSLSLRKVAPPVERAVSYTHLDVYKRQENDCNAVCKGKELLLWRLRRRSRI